MTNVCSTILNGSGVSKKTPESHDYSSLFCRGKALTKKCDLAMFFVYC